MFGLEVRDLYTAASTTFEVEARHATSQVSGHETHACTNLATLD